jgi:hypothetical protein
MRIQVQKPYDILLSVSKTAETISDYVLFCYTNDYNEYDKNVPIYMRLPRGKCVKLGEISTRKINPTANCYIVIAR